jgi:molecular chaperone HscB
MQYYEALGLEPKLALDLDDLKKRFYERSRQWHPDRFTRAEPRERQQALDMTALLNDSFRTLRDPVARAEYFLRQNGIEFSKDVPPELLEEVFELNMALEEVRGGDVSARPQLESARERFSGMLQEIDDRLQRLFDEQELDEIRAVLNRRRYISNLVREVDKELSSDPHNAPRRGEQSNRSGGSGSTPGAVR